jgi:hypothetical protein
MLEQLERFSKKPELKYDGLRMQLKKSWENMLRRLTSTLEKQLMFLLL